MNNVLLHSFTYDSADGEDTVELAEDALKKFDAQPLQKRMFELLKNMLMLKVQCHSKIIQNLKKQLN